MLFAALKDKKSSHDKSEEKYAFQIIAIELYKQQQQQKTKTEKEHLRLIISSIRVDVPSSVPEQLVSF